MQARTINKAILAALLLCAGTVSADFRAGQKAYEAGRYEDAVRLWQAAGRQGDLESIYHLGKLYGEGFGVLEDPVKAYALFSVAAAKGHKASLIARQIIREEMTVDERGAARQLAADYLQSFFAPGAKSGEKAPAQAKVVVAGSVRLVRESDTDILNLSNSWLNTNAEAVRRFLPPGRQWQFIEAYRYPRNQSDMLKLCREHNAYAVFGTRLRADTAHHNRRREHVLAWFDCRRQVERSSRREATKHNGKWNIDTTVAEFAAALKLRD